MASIKCPGCGARLQSYLIDVIEGGGQLTGAGGLTCPSCGENISHYEISRLLTENAFEGFDSSGRGGGCAALIGIVVVSLGLAALLVFA